MEPTPIAEMKFEAALAELEAAIAAMENGQLTLEASIAAHQRGVALIRHCQAQLDEAEGQVRIIEAGLAREADRNLLERP